jgi:hypothetical protein
MPLMLPRLLLMPPRRLPMLPPPIEPYFGAHGEATIRAASLPSSFIAWV